MSTNTQGVLSSLLAEDRPWTIEELVREKGNRLEVVDAIAELDALGLLNRINKRVSAPRARRSTQTACPCDEAPILR